MDRPFDAPAIERYVEGAVHAGILESWEPEF